MEHTEADTREEFDAVASRLWFEHCDMQGWPNGLPTWGELKEFTGPEWVRVRQEYEAMAAGAMEVCDHFQKRRSTQTEHEGNRMSDICECPKCGRTHRDLGFGAPPSLPLYTDFCALSVLVNRHMDLNINQPGYRLNEWLKQFIELTRPGAAREPQDKSVPAA